MCCTSFSLDLSLDTILSLRFTENSLDFMAWFVLQHAMFDSVKFYLYNTNSQQQISQGNLYGKVKTLQ